MILVGALGDDSGGEQILAAAAAAGVDTRGVTVDPRLPTAVTAALVRPDGERAFASDFGCQREWGAAEILADPERLIGAQALCVVGQFNIPGLTISGCVDVLRAGRAGGATTVVDTGWDPAGWTAERRQATRAMLTEVDVFLPNLDEARAIVGSGEPEALAASLLADGAGAAVVKCGADGSVGRAGDALARAGTFPVQVRDLVGAGDAFDAGFLLGHLDGRSLADAMTLGAAAAGLRVSGSATHWPARAETEVAARSVPRQLS